MALQSIKAALTPSKKTKHKSMLGLLIFSTYFLEPLFQWFLGDSATSAIDAFDGETSATLDPFWKAVWAVSMLAVAANGFTDIFGLVDPAGEAQEAVDGEDFYADQAIRTRFSGRPRTLALAKKLDFVVSWFTFLPSSFVLAATDAIGPGEFASDAHKKVVVGIFVPLTGFPGLTYYWVMTKKKISKTCIELVDHNSFLAFLTAPYRAFRRNPSGFLLGHMEGMSNTAYRTVLAMYSAQMLCELYGLPTEATSAIAYTTGITTGISVALSRYISSLEKYDKEADIIDVTAAKQATRWLENLFPFVRNTIPATTLYFALGRGNSYALPAAIIYEVLVSAAQDHTNILTKAKKLADGRSTAGATAPVQEALCTTDDSDNSDDSALEAAADEAQGLLSQTGNNTALIAAFDARVEHYKKSSGLEHTGVALNVGSRLARSIGFFLFFKKTWNAYAAETTGISDPLQIYAMAGFLVWQVASNDYAFFGPIMHPELAKFRAKMELVNAQSQNAGQYFSNFFRVFLNTKSEYPDVFRRGLQVMQTRGSVIQTTASDAVAAGHFDGVTDYQQLDGGHPSRQQRVAMIGQGARATVVPPTSGFGGYGSTTTGAPPAPPVGNGHAAAQLRK